jgi:hypothetical protein
VIGQPSAYSRRLTDAVHLVQPSSGRRDDDEVIPRRTLRHSDLADDVEPGCPRWVASASGPLGEVAARELRNRERSSDEAGRLDDRCGRPTGPLRFNDATKDSA